MKIKLILLFVLLFSFTACKNELKNDIRFIENLSNNETLELPFYNESVKIFIKIDETVYVTRLRQLYFLRDKNYKEYQDFDKFLVKAINGKLLSKSDLDENWIPNFSLNKKILNEFNTKDLDYLKNAYCENANMKNKYYTTNILDWDAEQTLLYIFFKNNYYITEDDYLGKTVLTDKN